MDFMVPGPGSFAERPSQCLHIRVVRFGAYHGLWCNRVRDFDYFFCIFLAASAAKNCEKRAVIQSAASAASAREAALAADLITA